MCEATGAGIEEDEIIWGPSGGVAAVRPSERVEHGTPLYIDQDKQGCVTICRAPEESDPNGVSQHEPGAKLDSGKVKAGVLLQFPRALMEIAKVGTYGCNKYTRGGWQYVENGVEWYADAEMRHALKGAVEEFNEEDEGLRHEAQKIWNALASFELKLREMEGEHK